MKKGAHPTKELLEGERRPHFSLTTSIQASEGLERHPPTHSLPPKIMEGATLECRTGREPCPCPISWTLLCPQRPWVGGLEVGFLAVLGFQSQLSSASSPHGLSPEAHSRS